MPVEVLGLYVERKGVRKQQIQRRRDVARCIRTETCRCMQRGSATILKVIVFHQVYPSVAALRPLRKYCFVRKVQVRGCDVLFHGILLWYADLVKGSARLGRTGHPRCRAWKSCERLNRGTSFKLLWEGGAPRLGRNRYINEYVAHHNKEPKPFIWTKSARDILQKSFARTVAEVHSERNTTIDARPVPGVHRQPPKRGVA